jgi:uncharacterized protein (DUF885 family)
MRKVTLEKVQKDLDGIASYEVMMYIYHSLNGHDEIAQDYLDTYLTEQKKILDDLQNTQTLQESFSNNNKCEPFVSNTVEEIKEYIENQNKQLDRQLECNIYDLHE